MIGPVDARRAAGDHDRPREQLLGRERHREDVVDAQVERPQLGLEVAATGQAEGRRPLLRQAVRGPQPPEERRAVVVVHVDDGQVRVPLGEDRLRLREIARRAHDEDAMVERQLDEIDDQRPVVQHEGAPRFLRQGLHVVIGHG